MSLFKQKDTTKKLVSGRHYEKFEIQLFSPLPSPSVSPKKETLEKNLYSYKEIPTQ